MLSRSRRWIALSSSLVLAIGAMATAAPKGTMSTYHTPEGEIFFAAQLEAGLSTDPTQGRDVVVLFDTSASQVGAYRTDAITALNKFLQSLGPKDRVKLVAVDLNATNLTDDFVAPTGAEMRLAKDKLSRRIPLGSTDMAAVMTAAADAFMMEEGNPRAAVYIGDGMTRANILTTAQFAGTCRGLVERRISFYSYVIGPSQGIHLLAALANHTGGMLIADSDDPSSAARAGLNLVHWVHGTVAWPTDVAYSAGITEVLPASFPPLRSDRESILVGKLADRNPQTIELTADVAGESQSLKFDLLPGNSNPDVAFLPKLVGAVRADGGMNLPTVGKEGLVEAGKAMLRGAESLAQLGRLALSTGDKTGADKLAGAALEIDPGNPSARALSGAAGGGAGLNSDLTLGPTAGPGFAPADDLLSRVEEERFILETVVDTDRVIQEQIEMMVNRGLEDARKKMGADSASAAEELKLLLEQVEKSPRLESAVRMRLRSTIEEAIRTANQLAIAESANRIAEQERIAAIQERERIDRGLLRRTEKLKELAARFNSLMDEGRYVEAQDQVAEEVRTMLPNEPAAEAMVWWSRNRGNVVQMAILREVRHRKFVDALFQVEKAHVPFPDEPPIVYPDPEVWEDLTIRRKTYASVDLATRGTAEQRIFEELDKETHLEFNETPLADVVGYLKDLHEIEIQLDTRALDGVGIGSDTPITRELRGVSLRSALRLMLKDLDLTYVVKDEVLQITTPEEAEANLVTKVYPVGDLVLPISNQAGANPFMLGGGLGGMGGFGGGMGGGGFCGGFCGGFGGGFMNIDDDLRLDRFEIRPR